MANFIHGIWIREEAWSAQLGALWEAMRHRYDPPPADQAHLWSEGLTDIDLADGTTRHGIKSWYLVEPYEAWVKLRWPETAEKESLGSA